MLIISACQKYYLLIEGLKTCNGAGWAGGDRVVIIFNALLFANKFNTVLNSGKLFCDLSYIFGAYISPYGGYGGKIVLNIVVA